MSITGEANSTFDVVIVGGSMVGAALAALLANESQLKVAVIEPLAIREPSLEQFEPRVSAISLASENIFKSLDVWGDIVNYRVSPYSTMEVWDDEGTGQVEFLAAEVDCDHLGHIIENQVMIAALWKRLRANKDLTLFERCRLSSFSKASDGWALEVEAIENPETSYAIKTELLVGADGANSMVRNQIGFELRAWDYHHQGIVATVTSEQSHQGCARQNFLATGPLALLPLRLSNEDTQLQHCSIVWSCTKERAQELLALDDEAFCVALTSASESQLGKITAASKRFSFPLRQQHAANYIAEGIALIGDAAHTIHPLAGQGVNLGILDAAVLAEELVKAKQAGVEISHRGILRRFERRRKGHNLLMMGAMEGFKRLFAAEDLHTRLVRNTGMKWFNSIPALKNKINEHALGLSGDLPASAGN